MTREKELMLFFILAAVLLLLVSHAPAPITGNVVMEGRETSEREKSMQESTTLMRDVSANIETIKDIIEEEQKEQKQQVFCQNECTPKGRSCDGSLLNECVDADFDGCLEFRTTTCTNGCVGNQCYEDSPPIKKPQSIRAQEPNNIITNETCTGKIIGSVDWNPHGSLCRKTEFGTTSGGLVKPLDCCKKFYYEAACTDNVGVLKRGLSAYSQFFLIGCYAKER